MWQKNEKTYVFALIGVQNKRFLFISYFTCVQKVLSLISDVLYVFNLVLNAMMRYMSVPLVYVSFSNSSKNFKARYKTLFSEALEKF